MNHLDHYRGPEPSIAVAQTLARRGGLTPDGFPIYRLVHSAHVMRKVGGTWNLWDKNLDVQDRGGIVTGPDGRPTQSFHRPDSVVVDVVEIQTYSMLEDHGWMLERWYPPSFFGTPLMYLEHVVPGTEVPLLGPYPERGAYLEIYGPAKQEPPISFLEDYIASWEERRANFPDDVEAHVRDTVNAALKREELRTERAERDNTRRLKESVKPLTSTTLEAGRWRSRSFERAGHTSHIGN